MTRTCTPQSDRSATIAARQEADRLRTGRLRWAQKHVILLGIYWGFALGSSLGERREDTSNVAVAGGLWSAFQNLENSLKADLS